MSMIQQVNLTSTGISHQAGNHSPPLWIRPRPCPRRSDIPMTGSWPFSPMLTDEGWMLTAQSLPLVPRGMGMETSTSARVCVQLYVSISAPLPEFGSAGHGSTGGCAGELRGVGRLPQGGNAQSPTQSVLTQALGCLRRSWAFW
ncbi:hypothetical protein F751_0388 [Auxenochlorella protothecoides]|uniref:Uncharacterized protein n=1 Tax=Auxenochlorella protothecoides TaxID=3075 RepID=A0A087SSR0_AUXPR|nr:hypothetical protein F751_0388 [Auxenochlorella protothecoides]KFM28764.1 hypothetical protein F751_0388 [Auxenochlorella protothecoides]